MKHIAFAIAAASAAAFATPVAAQTIWDVEGARANARAGGPISEYDAWILDRWGTTSGTPNWRHRPRYSTFEFNYDDQRRYKNRKYKRRRY